MKRLLSLLVISVSLLSCGGHQSGGQAETGDTVFFKYAKLLTVVKYKDYTDVSIKNPWKEGKVLHRYRLVSANAAEMHHAVDGATVVCVPLQRSVVFTSVHAAILEQLHAEKQVAGVADLKYMKVSYVQEGTKNGHIIDRRFPHLLPADHTWDHRLSGTHLYSTHPYRWICICP